MKFSSGKLPVKLEPLRDLYRTNEKRPIWDRLQSIAKAFVDLQAARHDADYDLTKNYTRNEAERLVQLAERAFSDWRAIRNDDLARIYLSCFLVDKAWDKHR